MCRPRTRTQHILFFFLSNLSRVIMPHQVTNANKQTKKKSAPKNRSSSRSVRTSEWVHVPWPKPFTCCSVSRNTAVSNLSLNNNYPKGMVLGKNKKKTTAREESIFKSRLPAAAAKAEQRNSRLQKVTPCTRVHKN